MSKKVNLNVCCYLCFETITQLTNATFYSARSMDTSIYTYITKRVWSMVILKVLKELAKVVLKNAAVDWTYKRNRGRNLCAWYIPVAEQGAQHHQTVLHQGHCLWCCFTCQQTIKHLLTLQHQWACKSWIELVSHTKTQLRSCAALSLSKMKDWLPLQNEMTTFPNCGLQSTVAFVENKLLEWIS